MSAAPEEYNTVVRAQVTDSQIINYSFNHVFLQYKAIVYKSVIQQWKYETLTHLFFPRAAPPHRLNPRFKSKVRRSHRQAQTEVSSCLSNELVGWNSAFVHVGFQTSDTHCRRFSSSKILIVAIILSFKSFLKVSEGIKTYVIPKWLIGQKTQRFCAVFEYFIVNIIKINF